MEHANGKIALVQIYHWLRPTRYFNRHEAHSPGLYLHFVVFGRVVGEKIVHR